MRTRKYLLALALIAGLAGCDRHPASSVSRKSAVPAGEVGSTLPDFDAKDLQGNVVSSRSLRGKVVLVDVWATWCGPCRKEMPGYQRLFEKYGSHGFAVVGLKSNMMMDTENPVKFAKEIGVHYPLVSASAELISKFGELQGLPTTMIYDREGILRKKVIGFDYLESFEESVKPLL